MILRVFLFLLIAYEYTGGCWNVKQQLGKEEGPGQLNQACGVALTPSNDIAVPDYKTAKVILYEDQGRHKMSLHIKEGLKPDQQSHPCQVLVNSAGTYYVTNWTQFVRVYNSDGEYQHQFATMSPEGKSSESEDAKLFGLTMDSNRHILVGEYKNKYISKHTEDGKHVESIKVKITPLFLEITHLDTTIISSGRIDRTVLMIDQKGRIMNTLKPPFGATYWSPRGAHCCKDIIFIANHADGSSDVGIYCYSMSGEYLGYINSGITGPTGLVITDNGNKMIVSQWQYGATILHKKSGHEETK